MKYKLIIDKNADEEIIAIVHAPSSLTQRIEDLVCDYSGAESIMGYSDDEMRKLTFQEIECVTIIDRKVIAIDTKGNHYSLKDRLRDLEVCRSISRFCSPGSRPGSGGLRFLAAPASAAGFVGRSGTGASRHSLSTFSHMIPALSILFAPLSLE